MIKMAVATRMSFINKGYTPDRNGNKNSVKSVILNVPKPAPVATSTPTDTVIPPVSIVLTPPTPTETEVRPGVRQPPDFDALFEHPIHFRFDFAGVSLDEGNSSSDYGSGLRSHYLDNSVRTLSPVSLLCRGGGKDSIGRSSASRVDSVMETTFNNMISKHAHQARNFMSFRRRVAIDINHKYCSYCRCDYMIFVFLYVLFGMAYISAGCLGLIECPDRLLVNIYLVAVGLLSVFVFPITVMEWTRRVGGCVNDTEKLGRGTFFFAVLLLRMTAVVVGTVLLIEGSAVLPQDHLMCLTTFILLQAGIYLEWAFLLLAIALPLMIYAALYRRAQRVRCYVMVT